MDEGKARTGLAFVFLGGTSMDPVHNERIKLAATAFNNAGVATFAAGILGPTIGYAYGTTGIETGGCG